MLTLFIAIASTRAGKRCLTIGFTTRSISFNAYAFPSENAWSAKMRNYKLTIASGPIAALVFPNHTRSQDIAFHRTPAATLKTIAVQYSCRSFWPAYRQSLSGRSPISSPALRDFMVRGCTGDGKKTVQDSPCHFNFARMSRFLSFGFLPAVECNASPNCPNRPKGPCPFKESIN